jgi:formyltetrahydrofolate deformylase
MADQNGSQQATLLVSCRDRHGLVAALAQTLYGHGVNIIDADQHTDKHEDYFFQRVVFDLGDLRTDRVSLERGIEEVTTRFEMDYRLHYADRKKRVALFVSNTDHCLYDLLLRQRAGELNGEIHLIVSNHEDLRPVAKQFDVPFQYYPIDANSKRAQEERESPLP